MSLEAENVTPPQKPQRRRGSPPANSAVDAQLDSIGVAAPAAPPPPAAAAATAPDDLMTLDQAAEQQQQPAPEREREREREPEPQTDELDLSPFSRNPLPPPKETKGQQKETRVAEKDALNKPTPSLKRFGELGKKLGGAEHIQVSKRMDNGELAYVGEYNTKDISQSQNIQAFLNRYVRPGYGPGEYQILGVDAHGREFDAGKVTLLAPMNGAPDVVPSVITKGPMDLLQQVLDREAQRQTSEIRALAQNQKDPIQMLRDMHELHQQFAPPPTMPTLQPSDGGSKNDAMSAMVTGMMGMMGTVLAVVLQPKPTDPLLLALINNLASSNNKPAPDATAQLVQLSEVVKNLQGNSGGGGGGKDDRLVDVLLKERMSPAEVLGLVQQVKGERGTDDLKKSMENVGMLLNAVQQLRAQTEPGTGSGFWEAVTTALSNPGLASVIGSRVRGATSGAPAPQQLPPPQQNRALPPGQTTDPMVLKARELAIRKMRLEEIEIAKREKALGIGKPTVTPPPAAEATAPGADAPVEAPAAALDAPPPEQTTTLPPNIADHVNSYLKAKDDGEIIQTTVEMIFSLAEDEKWKPYSEVIVAFVMQSDRARFLQYMASLFVSLRTIGLIEDGLARKIMETLQRNFETIVSVMREQVEQVEEGAEAEGDEGDEGEQGEGDGEGEEPEDLLQLD